MPEDNRTIFFWGRASWNGFLDQWYPAPFVFTEPDGSRIIYQCAEQYMMHRKGLLFAPHSEITAQILLEHHPGAMKALGRFIPDFDEEIWREERYQIVVKGNYLKFTQNEELKAKLIATEDQELVEASPVDRIWGIGFTGLNAEEQREKWGLNLLGKALMEVREVIQREDDIAAVEVQPS